MLRLKNSITIILLCITVFSVHLCLPPAAYAYIDLAPTLSKIIADSKSIVLVEVTEFDRPNCLVVFKAVRGLKGDMPAAPIRHRIAPADGGTIPREILQWAGTGAQCVLFVSRSTALVCVGQGWYQARASEDGLWKLGTNRPDLPLAYYGSVPRLAEGIELMLAGKNAIITVVPHDTSDASNVDLALNRFSLPGLIQPKRIRADMKMPTTVASVGANPAYLVGKGAVGVEDLPSVIQRLKSQDPAVQAEAAGDLRSLGRKAQAAAESLADLLDDKTPSVRLSAASALLVIAPPNPRSIEILSQGLASDAPTVRRDAAIASGLAGPSAAPLIERLAGLLKDSDESVRIASLQAIATLGPVAAKAADAVVPLLDDPELAIDAADALGRIGPAAQPVPSQLVKMLSSEQADMHRAALRAMAQIGGREARPAVDFIIRAMPDAPEIEAYNMAIYLALLGPEAVDALPYLHVMPVKNPVLSLIVRWAVESDRTLPWQAGGEFGMPGMMMAGGGPTGGIFDMAVGGIYAGVIREMGERLRPTTRLLAKKIMDGTAGNVPDWGYQILACAPDESIKILVPYLTDANMVMRERAAVALGFMGPAASPAKNQVAAAIDKVSSEREERLIQWCLREITRQ
jgi:HEAT repeat protein